MPEPDACEVVIGEANLEEEKEEEEVYTSPEKPRTASTNGYSLRKRNSQNVVTVKNHSTPKEGYRPRFMTSELESSSFDCKICSDLFSSLADLKRHYDDKHQSDIVNQCCFCLESFKR